MFKRMSVAFAAIAQVSAPVQASCWERQEISAGTIRDLQSMLMVATLRCQVMKVDITGDYNVFLQANKSTIQKMNDRLKLHFIKAHGPVDGQRHYDAFATSLANGYGSRQGDAEVCSSTASLAREAAMMAGSEEGLALLAQRQGINTLLPEGACGVDGPTLTVASATIGRQGPAD